MALRAMYARHVGKSGVPEEHDCMFAVLDGVVIRQIASWAPSFCLFENEEKRLIIIRHQKGATPILRVLNYG